MIRLGITGTRLCTDYALIKHYLDTTYPNPKEIKILVSGHARGIDTLCEIWAKENGIEIDSHPPDWKKFGKGAAFIRNQEIVDNCDEMVAFPLKEGSPHFPSNGTMDTCKKATKAGKKVLIIQVPEDES
jgi:hypothetical protein